MDYRYRLCSTNCHHAQLEDDGELILIVAHTDPGFPNWLDPSGHEEGYITVRWVGAEHYPTPECTQMKATDLESFLSASTITITPAQRQQQLEAATIREIARSSGCSRGVVEHYFDGKDELIGGALAWANAQYEQRVSEATRDRLGLDALLARLAQGF